MVKYDPIYSSLTDSLVIIDWVSYNQGIFNGTISSDVANGKYVVVDAVENLQLIKLYSKTPKALRIGDTRRVPLSFVFLLQKNLSSVVREIINARLSRFIETAQLAPFALTYAIIMSDSVDKAEDLSSKPLNLNDLLPLFVIHAVGNLLSMFCIFSEINCCTT